MRIEYRSDKLPRAGKSNVSPDQELSTDEFKPAWTL